MKQNTWDESNPDSETRDAPKENESQMGLRIETNRCVFPRSSKALDPGLPEVHNDATKARGEPELSKSAVPSRIPSRGHIPIRA